MKFIIKIATISLLAAAPARVHTFSGYCVGEVDRVGTRAPRNKNFGHIIRLNSAKYLLGSCVHCPGLISSHKRTCKDTNYFSLSLSVVSYTTTLAWINLHRQKTQVKRGHVARDYCPNTSDCCSSSLWCVVKEAVSYLYTCNTCIPQNRQQQQQLKTSVDLKPKQYSGWKEICMSRFNRFYIPRHTVYHTV